MRDNVMWYVLLLVVYGNLQPVAFSQEVKPVVPAQAENINTPENFPDPNFRRAVEEVLGVGPRMPFTVAQAARVIALDVSGREISDLAGIQFFPSFQK